jgi:hypothetical protein
MLQNKAELYLPTTKHKKIPCTVKIGHNQERFVFQVLQKIKYRQVILKIFA